MEKNYYTDNENVKNVETRPMPKPKTEIGIDIEKNIINNITDGVTSGNNLDISVIESFTQVSQNRNQLYDLIDNMSEDSTIAAALETYAEDATEYNDSGKIVWVESSDPDVQKYINYLLESINVDKHVYKWVYNLVKYGDLYVRLYRNSDISDALFAEEKDTQLNEDINVKTYSRNDQYVHYVEMCPNPAEIFELTKFGKTYAYIEAPSNILNTSLVTTMDNSYSQQFNSYKFKKNKDINIYDPTCFVHASLEDNSNRSPEEVNIFLNDADYDNNSNALTYKVKRGQSLLYNTFKIWRELTLLENAVLLNRLTKSSIIRLINVEVGDMPKESVGPHMMRIKNMIEQKAAINESNSFSEYTNPGPIENNVYIPTHDGKGTISTSQVGGDVDVKSLIDLDYFKNKLFASIKIPKQYFGETDDAAGFNGGTSLSIISSRYAKTIKRIQNTVVQMTTDIVNLMLLDKKMNNYINKFEIHMLPPTTQEEIDRRENLSSKVQITSDIMNLFGDVEDNTIKLKVLKDLLSGVVSDTDILTLLQEEIDRIEQENSEEEIDEVDSGDDLDNEKLDFNDTESNFAPSMPSNMSGDTAEGQATETTLPSPSDLGVDFTDSSNDDFT